MLGLDDRLSTAWSVAEPEQPGQPWSTYPAPLPTVVIARTQGGLVRLSADRGQPILTVTAPDLVPNRASTIPGSRRLPRTTTRAASAGPTRDCSCSRSRATDAGCSGSPRPCTLRRTPAPPRSSAAVWSRPARPRSPSGRVRRSGATRRAATRSKSFPQHTWIDAVTRLRPVGVDEDDPRYADAIQPSEADADWRFDPPGARAESRAATPGQRFVGYDAVGWSRCAGMTPDPSSVGWTPRRARSQLSSRDGCPRRTSMRSTVSRPSDPPGVLVIDRDDGEARYFDAP